MVSRWDNLSLLNYLIFSLFLYFLFSGFVHLKYIFSHMIWKEYEDVIIILLNNFRPMSSTLVLGNISPSSPIFPLSWLDAEGQQFLHRISIWILCYRNTIFALNPSLHVAYFIKRNKYLEDSNIWEWRKWILLCKIPQSKKPVTICWEKCQLWKDIYI